MNCRLTAFRHDAAGDTAGDKPVPGLTPGPLTVGSGLSGTDGLIPTFGLVIGETIGDINGEPVGWLFWFVHPAKTATSAMIIIIAIISFFIKSPPLNLFLTNRRLIISADTYNFFQIFTGPINSRSRLCIGIVVSSSKLKI